MTAIRVQLMLTVFILLTIVGCQKVKDTSNVNAPIVSPTKSKEDIQRQVRDKKIASMEQQYSEPDRPAKVTLSDNDETLTLDSTMVTCNSVAPLTVNPDNNKVYRDLGVKTLVVIDPKHSGGKCTFDVSKTTY